MLAFLDNTNALADVLRTGRAGSNPAVGDEDVDRILEYRSRPEVTRWLLRTGVDPA